jgi:hypothetical protein
MSRLAYRDLSKLLLLSCSQRKRLDEGLLPAIDRYDGPVFRLLRRYLRQEATLSVDVKILSAEYGLISNDYFLPYYDRRITKEQSKKLHYRVIRELETVFNSKPYTNLLICLGKDYLEAIYGYEAIIPSSLTVQIATGGIGRKLSILHDWLYGDSSSLQREQGLASTKGTTRIRDVEVTLTSEQVLDIARQAIATKDRRATHYQSWYVQVDDQRVAPKWLVSQLTGLPVSNFVTDDARRVLTRLGVEVKRV